MSIRLIAIILSSLLIFHPCRSQERGVKGIKNGVLISTSLINVKVQFYDDNIVRVVKWKPGMSDRKISLSVIIDSLPSLPIKVDREGSDIVLTSRRLTIKVSEGLGRVELSNLKLEIILKESDYGFVPVIYRTDSAFSIKQGFELAPNEGIFGLGQHQDGYMNYRGKTVKLV